MSSIRDMEDGTGSAEMAGHHEELTRRVLWKLDLHVLPPLALLWLANFIDRSNIGNARVAGLGADLHLVGNEFNSALAVFYAAYVVSELPSNLILKKMRPNRWLPIIVTCWGLVTTLSGFTQTYGGLLGVRIVLGFCEGGLLPGMVLYLSTLYTRHELQLRIGIFYASASLSGAFGGLLAAVIIKMDGVGGEAGWRWIFILEGLATIIAGFIAAAVLPQNLESAKFFSEEERAFAIRRFHADGATASRSIVAQEPTSGRARAASEAGAEKTNTEKNTPQYIENSTTAREEEVNEPRQDLQIQDEQFEWREVRRGIFDVQTWLTALAYMAILISLYSLSLFLPTIIQDLGWLHTKTQLMSVPPYIPAAFLTVIIAFLSDRYKQRMIFAMGLLAVSIAGYILEIAATSNSARYGAVFLMTAGVYPAVPCILTILPNNHRGHYKRATSTALQLAIANCAGFIATFAYTSDQAKTFYKKGHSVVLGFLCFAFVCLALNLLYCRWENKARLEGRRDGNVAKWEEEKANGKTRAPIGDRAPDFLFTY